MFSVYILWSPTLEKFYVGQTDNLPRRLDEHNHGRSQFTKLGIPWTLVYSEQFDSRSEALKREAEIKNKKSRKYIERLIKQHTAGSERPVTIA